MVEKGTEKYPRGIACHEAGHAVVAFSFSLRVAAIRVVFSEEKGWHGCTKADTPQAIEDRITLLSAGKAAEEFFDCPADGKAWHDDLLKISLLLGLPSELPWPQINEGKARARPILEKYREQALRLTDRLVERGRVDDAEFLRLMNAV